MDEGIVFDFQQPKEWDESRRSSLSDDSIHVESTEEGQESILMTLMESGGRTLVPTVKAVFEHDWSDTFVHTIDAFIKKKEADINKICRLHYEVR